MFKRLILEHWHGFVPYLCFTTVAVIFGLGVIYALRLKKEEVERLSRLPLEDPSEIPADATHPDTKIS